ncbi:MAG: hypothetical protein AB1505_20880, partial [Candidatus Latescibacterota bacterium]
AAPCCLVLLVWGDSLVALLYGPQYAGHGLLVSLLAVDLLASCGQSTFARGLMVVERADVDLWANSLSIAVLVLLGIQLVRLHGPLGVALAMLIANVVTSVAKCIAFTLLTRRPLAPARA